MVTKVKPAITDGVTAVFKPFGGNTGLENMIAGLISGDKAVTHRDGNEYKVIDDFFGDGENSVAMYTVSTAGSVDLGGGLFATEANMKGNQLITYTNIDQLGIDDSFFTPNSTQADRQDRLNDLAELMGDDSAIQWRITSSSGNDNFRACMPVDRQGLFTLRSKTTGYWSCSYHIVSTTTEDQGRYFVWGRYTTNDWSEIPTQYNDYDFYQRAHFWGSAVEPGKVRKNDSTARDEVQIYSNERATGTGSTGSGIHLYGNADIEHAGNVALITGQDDSGVARLIVSGGSNNPLSDGYRTNTDTRVTIGNSIWDFVDDQNDTAMLTLRNPQDRPAILSIDSNTETEGDMAVPDGQAWAVGHWDSVGEVFTPRMRMSALGNWTPHINGVGNIGSDDRRWDVIKAITGTIDTSDRATKASEKLLSDTEKRVALKCKALVKTYQIKTAVESKGDEARLHTGLIAQDVVEAFESEGLDPYRYGIVCLAKWDDEYSEVSINKGKKENKEIDSPVFALEPVIKYENTLINDKWVRVKVESQRKTPVMDELPLFNEDGEQISVIEVQRTEKKIIQVDAPYVTESVKIRDAGEQLGLRYTELLCFIIGSM